VRPSLIVAATAALSVCGSLQSEAQDGTNVLVIANAANSASVQIAEEYVAARAVPNDQLLRLKITNSEQLSRADFEQQIQGPVAAWLATHGLQDRILYIVLTKGVPLQISGSSGRQGSAASVDSELTLLYRRLTGVSVPINGPVPNPYFARSAEEIKSPKPFNRATYDTYLVTRLDGFTTADALALITRGLAPRQDGRILMDAPLVTGDPRVGWMDEAANRLREGGFADRVVVENTGRALQNEADVLGYMSWGSNDPALYVRHPNLTFIPGAVASMFLSSDARTFVEPPSSWKPGLLPQNSYSGSAQSLTADLIRSGVTGVAGQVSEPYVDGAVRPDILFPAYLKGLNLAESFYLATPSLSWQTVVIGDPLCAPFRTAAFGETQAEPPVDADTALPAHFSARRLATLQGLATTPALKLMLRAETREARGDSEGALDALKKASTADSASTFVWHALAIAHERRGDHAESAADYRQILALNATDVVALNNLAYNLTVHDNRPRDAYAYAARAAALTRNNPTVDDTLGWIHHLLGDNAQALVLLDRASRSLPNNAEVQFHAAVVYAATGRLHEAAQLLKGALALDPSLGRRRDVRDLQQSLRAKH
jgi:uncharacterized protein (TIGR03790 family)